MGAQSRRHGERVSSCLRLDVTTRGTRKYAAACRNFNRDAKMPRGESVCIATAAIRRECEPSRRRLPASFERQGEDPVDLRRVLHLALRILGVLHEAFVRAVRTRWTSISLRCILDATTGRGDRMTLTSLINLSPSFLRRFTSSSRLIEIQTTRGKARNVAIFRASSYPMNVFRAEDEHDSPCSVAQ